MKKITLLFACAMFVTVSAFSQAFTGVGWVNWNNEPAALPGGAVPTEYGYAANEIENPFIEVLQAPAAWDFTAMNVDMFEDVWSMLGDSNAVANITSDPLNGTFFDLDGAATSGAAFKAIHDGDSLFLLIKFWDENAQSTARLFEVMTQPKMDLMYHEPTFDAAVNDSTHATAAAQIGIQNMAWARLVPLGGNKVVFENGAATANQGSDGLASQWNNNRGYYQGGWTTNEISAAGINQSNHFYDVDANGLMRAVFSFPFGSALAQPADPTVLAAGSDVNPTEVGDYIVLDIKSQATVGGQNIAYFWASHHNQGYASNWYSALAFISDELVDWTSTPDNKISDVNVYVANNTLNIEGIQNNTTVEIYSVTGALVKSASNVSGTLSINDLTNGVYLVKVEGSSEVYKILK